MLNSSGARVQQFSSVLSWRFLLSSKLLLSLVLLFLRDTGIDSSLTLYLPSITDCKNSMSWNSMYIESGNIFKARSLSVYPIVSFSIRDFAFCCTNYFFHFKFWRVPYLWCIWSEWDNITDINIQFCFKICVWRDASFEVKECPPWFADPSCTVVAPREAFRHYHA